MPFARLFLAILVATSCARAVESPTAADPDVNEIFQYFVPSQAPDARPNSGAYLWIPPEAGTIHAVMIGAHNGLPLPILQHPAVRAICRKHGIAQILLTPNGSEIGPVMLKDLAFDISDPERTAIFDSYLTRLAETSGHPELATAPMIPLAHSAYASFPFDIAMRDPSRCLALIPIKAGLPTVYKFYAPGGKALHPDASRNLGGVPILFLQSASQETVGWSAYPRGGTSYPDYRKDHADNDGSSYEPGNELFGANWDMMSGHFDLLPWNYEFVAKWIDAIATARLLPDGKMRPLNLKDGWLVDPRVPAAGDLPADFPLPAPYAEFTGDKSKALWFSTRELAEEQFTIYRDEPRREIELFTFLDGEGKPVSLAHGHMAEIPKNSLPLNEDGSFVLTTHHLTSPPQICTNKERGHEKNPGAVCTFENAGFPDRDSLPVSQIPLHFDSNASVLELVDQKTFTDDRGLTETQFTIRVKRNRLSPEVGYLQIYPRVFHQGDPSFAATGRTAKLEWTLPDLANDGASQTIDFPEIADAPAGSPAIPLGATSSEGLPVSYFVVQGPGVVRDGSFLPFDVPENQTKPIAVTIGAFQNGRYGVNPVKPAPTVYRTFQLIP